MVGNLTVSVQMYICIYVGTVSTLPGATRKITVTYAHLHLGECIYEYDMHTARKFRLYP